MAGGWLVTSEMDVNKRIKKLRAQLNYSEDVVVRSLQVGDRKGKMIYIETLVDDAEIVTLLEGTQAGVCYEKKRKEWRNDALLMTDEFETMVKQLMNGSTIFCMENERDVFVFGTYQSFARSPDEPANEKVVRGSHQGFVEDLDVNINLVRQRVQNPQLTIEYITVGSESQTKVAVIYLADIANKKVVKKITKQVRNISSDMAFSPGFIEEYIEENPSSVFPQLLYTERPDRAGANIIEGRVIVMGEGSSDAIILPVSFFSFFQSPDDYHKRPYVGTLFRLLRIISFWGSLLLPALYIAVIGFHFEIIPNELIALVKKSIETVPFPPFFETLIMIFTIELIREAGIRLPTSIGQTIGIVGGIIIGESVVNAGLVSNVVVIVVAVTAIMSFTISSYEMGNTVRLLSFPFMIAAALFGFVGIVLSLIMTTMHLCRIESYGTPYFSPLAPFSLQGMKDAFVRLPNPLLSRRPRFIHTQKDNRTKRMKGSKK